MTTLDFIVNMFAGESGNSLVESLIVSTVIGLEFNIPSGSTSPCQQGLFIKGFTMSL